MPRAPKFTPTRSPDGWRINVPATVSASGRREQYFFATREAARAHAENLRRQVREHGRMASAIRPTLASDATAAAAILERWGATLTEAARFFAAAKEAQEGSKTVAEAVPAFLLSCEGLRPRTVDSYRQALAKLEDALGGRLLVDLAPEEIASAAQLDRPGASAANRYRCVRAFWRWSAKKGWCDAEAFAAITAPRTNSDGEITVLTVQECAALLAAAEGHFPQAVASYALQLFGGVRVEEVGKLEPRHVSPTGIDLPASVSKKGRRRHITPSPTLQAWLEAYPFEPCPNWRDVNNACRRLAGWAVSARHLRKKVDAGEIPAPPPPHRGRWPQNAMRHSHASYALAAGGSLEQLIFEFGHSGGPELLRSNYVGRVSKKAALQFFSLRPGGETEVPKLEVVGGAA